MNWLLTVCDGSSGYKTVRLISEGDAAKLLATDSGSIAEDRYLDLLRRAGAQRKAVQFEDSESTLYPVPDQVEPADDLLEDPDCDDEFDFDED